MEKKTSIWKKKLPSGKKHLPWKKLDISVPINPEPPVIAIFIHLYQINAVIIHFK